MAVSYNKRELEKKKQSKKLEKQQRKEDRKANKGGSSLDDMIAYVDANGVITDTPPDMQLKKEEIDIETIAVSTPKKENVEIPILQGRVEFFNPDKGFGFIKDINSTEKYFFHISNAPADIAEGLKVTFDTERGPKGMNATKIEIIK
ncbi:cold-shock protein [uncultured Bacteroides sp.]|uniref:cold-shock protein n=1 Tax=uncultured Bacteroides sp. TaxID=162156 RepID=UPI0025F5F82E|nr:cold shock domain-containing protein [uncultured Bacteroides sp.]